MLEIILQQWDSSTTASGTYSTAIGFHTAARDYASTVIGHYNSSGSSTTSAHSFSTSAPAFVIGNGTDTVQNRMLLK